MKHRLMTAMDEPDEWRSQEMRNEPNRHASRRTGQARSDCVLARDSHERFRLPGTDEPERSESHERIQPNMNEPKAPAGTKRLLPNVNTDSRNRANE
jgi:hypothetical protein